MVRIARSFPRCVGLVVALLLVCAPMGAKSDNPPADEGKKKTYEGKLKDLKKKAGASHATLGSFCFDKKLYENALAEYQRALQHDPENSKARERLGFVKKDGAWAEDPKKAPKRKDEAPEATKYALLDQYKSMTKKEGDTLADAFFELGDWCKKNGFEEEAKDNFRATIDYSRDHAKAREALGFKKNDKGAWVGADDRAEKDAMKKKTAGAAAGDKIEKDTDDDKAVGTKMAKRQSTHFLFQTTLPDALLADLIKLAEVTWDEFYKVFEVPTDKPLVDGLTWGILLTTQKEHWDWIDKMIPGSEGNRDWYKKGGGHWKPDPPMYEGYKGSESDDGIRDFVIHYTTHVMFNYYMNPNPNVVKPWLYEGMADFFTHRLMRTGLTNCVVQATGGGNKKGVPRDSDYWKQFIREAVVKGEAPEMRRVMTTGVNELDGEMLVKAWSVIEFLMGTKKKEFFAFLEALKETKGDDKEQEAALKSALGWDYAELDRQWTEYVKKSY